MIWEHQSEYYNAIQDSTENNDSGIFIEFMLTIIRESLKKHIKNNNANDSVNNNVKLTKNQIEILEAIRQNPFVTQEELSKIVGITAANINLNMKKLQQARIIKRIGADKNGKWEVVE